MTNQGFKVRSDPKRDELDVVVAALIRGRRKSQYDSNPLAVDQSMAREAIEALDHHRRARDT